MQGQHFILIRIIHLSLILCYNPSKGLFTPDPLLWTGHATIIDETVRQGVRPDAIVVSVGGGGLLCGVIEGVRRNGLSTVPVIAVETEGTASLAGSLQRNRNTEIERITGIATSLGAKKVPDTAFAPAVEHQRITI